MLESMEDLTHEEHESFMEWVGPGFNPTTFDLNMAFALRAAPALWRSNSA